MRRWVSLVIVFAFAASLSTAPVTATDNQPPTAAAGLDQAVTAGTTVYLDAGGSYDEDGAVTATEWSIRAPNGSTVTPSCRDCQVSTFTPNSTGRWTVTITVTDDDGATATDTLYVTVEELRGPSVRVGIPPTIVAGQQTPVVAEATAGSAPLQRIQLFHDGSRVDRFDVSGDSATVTANHVFSSSGTTRLRAVATDIQGYVNTMTVSGEVAEPASEGGATALSSIGGSQSATGGSGSNRCRAIRVGDEVRTPGSCDEDEDKFVHFLDDEGNVAETRLVDTSGDGELTTTVSHPAFESGSKQVNVANHTNISKYEINDSPGVLQIDYDAARSVVEDSAVEQATSEQNQRTDDNNPNPGNGGNDNSENVVPGSPPEDANYGGTDSSSSRSTSSSPSGVNSGTSGSPSIGSGGFTAPTSTGLTGSSSSDSGAISEDNSPEVTNNCTAMEIWQGQC